MSSVCVFPTLCWPPHAPSTVATIVYRVVQVYFCSASVQLFGCSLENETNTNQQLVFPFQAGTPFSSDPEDRDCFEADCFTWRSQGQVNNIIAAVEKCHWQLEKVRDFTPWTLLLLQKSLWCPVLSEKEMNLDILLAGWSRGWGRGSFSVPAPSCPIRKQPCYFIPLPLSKENRVQVGRWEILLYYFTHQRWDLLCFDHGSATSRIAGQTKYPFPKMGWKHAV